MREPLQQILDFLKVGRLWSRFLCPLSSSSQSSRPLGWEFSPLTQPSSPSCTRSAVPRSPNLLGRAWS